MKYVIKETDLRRAIKNVICEELENEGWLRDAAIGGMMALGTLSANGQINNDNYEEQQIDSVLQSKGINNVNGNDALSMRQALQAKAKQNKYSFNENAFTKKLNSAVSKFGNFDAFINGRFGSSDKKILNCWYNQNIHDIEKISQITKLPYNYIVKRLETLDFKL